MAAVAGAICMPYRRTENVVRKLAAREHAILAAARALAAEGGMAAVQIAAVAARAGIAAGTVYRYYPSKTELVAALSAALSAQDMAALARMADAAPGPLSALAAMFATFAARTSAQRPLVFAMMAEPVEPDIDAARAAYRAALAAEFERRIRSALAGGHLPDQDAALAAAALIGALIESLTGALAPPAAADAETSRAQIQALTLFALRALGVGDARARGLVVQTPLPGPDET
jgi:AcrR family transcriptional regulator